MQRVIRKEYIRNYQILHTTAYLINPSESSLINLLVDINIAMEILYRKIKSHSRCSFVSRFGGVIDN